MLVPALLIRMSRRPRRPAVSSTIARQDSASRTSAFTAAVLTPRPASSAATTGFLSWFRPATATDAPAPARAAAMARPIPLLAPVTSATFPVRLNMRPTSLRPMACGADGALVRGSSSLRAARGGALAHRGHVHDRHVVHAGGNAAAAPLHRGPATDRH